MKNLKRLLALAALCCFFLVSSAASSQGADPASLVVAGSGVNLGITKLLAEAFRTSHPDVEIKVPGSIGSKGAITAVADKAIAIGLISRPLKEKERSPDYTVLAYARTPIVIAVHTTVKDDGLSSSELVEIYKGSKTRWQDGKEIIVQSREAFDSGFMVLEDNIIGFREACADSRKHDRWTTYFTDQEANEALASRKYAIGVTDLGMIATEKLGVRPLKLDGVMPSVESLQSGTYPLSRTLYLLYRGKTLPKEATAFIDFIFSPEGAEILKANGYLPLERER